MVKSNILYTSIVQISLTPKTEDRALNKKLEHSLDTTLIL